MKKTEQKGKMKKALIVGAGVTALAAATYYFFGPGGKQHRTSFKGWMIKMKGEIVEKMENAKDITEELYHGIVDAVAARYKKQIAESDLQDFVTNLKKQWKGIARSHAPKKVKSKAGAVTKKVAKKSSKKTK